MSQVEFVRGQRWISNTEPELGLGIIIEVMNRRVEISFPAVGEKRTYATNNAPLSRVQYHIGDNIFDQDDQPHRITSVEDLKGFVIYVCQDADGNTVNLPETELKSAVHLSSPVDRLLAGQLDKLSRYRLRLETLGHWGRWHSSPAQGLLGARVQLLPHQLYIANEVGQRHAPRVLLADEVGLGKTIEAGLILHQQILSGRASRVLIVVPESLVHQWFVEMLRRFNLHFSLLNEEQCQELESSNNGQNPFECTQLVICSLALLETESQQASDEATGGQEETFEELSSSEQKPRLSRFEQALAAQWDLVVVDEAHHLQWSPDNSSLAYQRIEAIAQQCLGLLLLTATPEQLGRASHFARLRLLDPARYPDLQEYLDEEASYAPLNELIQHLLAEDGKQQLLQSAELQEKLATFIGRTSLAALQAELQSDKPPEEVLFDAAKSLLDRHGTGRVLFRNTRHAIKGFPQRELTTWPLAAPATYQQQVTQADLSAHLQPELLLGEDWLSNDPRVPWLLTWLKSHRTEKTLIICARATTAIDLENHLTLRGGVRAAVFHEGLSLIERDRAGAWFADLTDGAQVLVCSEIGSEGRNFQFASNLIFFDLPLNPDLLEQRIGRLDRIGQQKDVAIHIPYYEQTAQEVLLRWYHEGMHAFERPFPGGQRVLQRFGEVLEQCLMSSDQAELAQLIEQTREFSEALVQELKSGRDPLLELNSCHPATAQEIIDNIVSYENELSLEDFMEAVFNQFGVDNDYHSEGVAVLRPGDHMLTGQFPELPEDGITVTYYRDIALSRDDLHFLSWEHPMVLGASELMLKGEFGNTTLCSIKLPPLQPGTILLESIYLLRCVAPKYLQAERYISQAMVRVLVDSKGNDLSEVIQTEHLNKLGEKVPLRNGQELIRQTRAQLESMVSKAREIALPRQKDLVDQAIAQMHQRQHAEIERLQALRQVNPNIREEEIAMLKEQTEQLSQLLQDATLEPEAIRIAVAT